MFFGSSAAFASAPILALILDPRLAVGMMLPLLMVMDATNLRPYWRKWSWPNARALLIGGVPGTFVGALISGIADADTFRLMIGAVALVSRSIGMGERARARRQPRSAASAPTWRPMA